MFESLETRPAPRVTACTCGCASDRQLAAPRVKTPLSSFTRGTLPDEKEVEARGIMDTRKYARSLGVDI